MATENDNEENEEEGENGESSPIPRKYVRDLEKRNKESEAKLQEFERRESLRAAGLGDLNDKQMKALVASHEGEQTPEAWRTTATELGFVTAEPETPTEVQQAHERVAGAAETGQTQVQYSAEDEYAKASTPEEVLAVARKHNSPVASDFS